MRLFIAVNLNEKVKTIISGSIDKLKREAVKGNFTHKENLHLTVVFIGETENVDAVMRAMDDMHGGPFEMSIGGLGRFKRDGGDIYWLGIDENAALRDAYHRLRKSLEKRGFLMENRGFKPHLTLGREVVLPKSFNENEFADSLPYIFVTVDGISLMKSERIRGKLTYTEIYRKQF